MASDRRSFFSSLLAAALAPALRFLPAPGRPEMDALPEPTPSMPWSYLSGPIIEPPEDVTALLANLSPPADRDRTAFVIVSSHDIVEDDLGAIEPGKVFRADGNYKLHSSDFGDYWTRTPNKEG